MVLATKSLRQKKRNKNADPCISSQTISISVYERTVFYSLRFLLKCYIRLFHRLTTFRPYFFIGLATLVLLLSLYPPVANSQLGRFFMFFMFNIRLNDYQIFRFAYTRIASFFLSFNLFLRMDFV